MNGRGLSRRLVGKGKITYRGMDHMENEELIRAGLEFVETCCLAQNQFDAWILHFNEKQLKLHFKDLVEVRIRLNELVHEAKKVVQANSP